MYHHVAFFVAYSFRNNKACNLALYQLQVGLFAWLFLAPRCISVLDYILTLPLRQFATCACKLSLSSDFCQMRFAASSNEMLHLLLFVIGTNEFVLVLMT